MRSTPRPLSDHRRARLTAWVRLWLVWLVGFYVSCCTHDPRTRRRELDRMAQRVGLLVFIEASMRRRRRAPRGRPYHAHAKRQHYRAWIGSHLRRVMRDRCWHKRLFALLDIMRDLEPHVVRMTRRLRRGVDIHAAMQPVREPAAALCFMPSDVACADSS